jgi:ribosomal protein S18 acetylase RimI-like enzyme
MPTSVAPACRCAGSRRAGPSACTAHRDRAGLSPPVRLGLRQDGDRAAAYSEPFSRQLLMSTLRPPIQFDPEISHQLERLAARAWPAAEVEEVEGWLLRRTDGVDRRRSNSLLPPPDPGHAARTVDLALAAAEDLGFAVAVQVSPAESHLRLDDALDARGMTFGGPSLVLAGRPRPAPAPAPRTDVTIGLSRLTHEWVAAWASVSGIAGTRETTDLVLSQLGDRARFAVAIDTRSQTPVAVGFGVAEERWLGLFSLATSTAARRRGVASSLVDALEVWAKTRGAERTYLQVEVDNAAALSFYAARGFRIAHSYHYRSA